MSSHEQNPYHSPATAPPPLPILNAPYYFRDGNLLVARDGADLPDICLKTNESPRGTRWRKQVTLNWIAPWAYALILLSPLIFLIVMIIVQKRGKITYTLGGDARGKVVRWRLIGLALLLVSAALFILAVNHTNTDIIIAYVFGGIVALLASLVPFTIANPIKVAGYDNGWFKLKGCSPSFLDSLPNNPNGF